jgi:hypothetical protein
MLCGFVIILITLFVLDNVIAIPMAMRGAMISRSSGMRRKSKQRTPEEIEERRLRSEKRRQEEEERRQDAENKIKYIMDLFERNNTCIVVPQNYYPYFNPKFTSFDSLHKDYVYLTREIKPAPWWVLIFVAVILFFVICMIMKDAGNFFGYHYNDAHINQANCGRPRCPTCGN